MRAAVIFLLMVTALSACAQKTTRKGLKARRTVTAATTPAVGEQADTIKGERADSILVLTGYEKPLRSGKETVFASNRDSARTAVEMEMEIEYLDMRGRSLHKRVLDVPLSLPGGETRFVSFKSWDINNVFYYHMNRPVRTKAQATPYTVKIRVVSLVLAGRKD